MPNKSLEGTIFKAEDKLNALWQKVIDSQFSSAAEIRQFINRYVSANPQDVRSKSDSVVDELINNIRTELGLAPGAQPGVVQIIPAHVRDLILGRAQASEDIARWAVHHAANQVTMYSGQFTYDAEDVFVDGAGMDFLFHRTYKSQGFHLGPLGVNWDHSLNLKLRVIDSGNKIVRLTGGFQESEYNRHGAYGQAGYNYWAPPPGEHAVIIEISSPAIRAEYGIQLPQSCLGCHYALRTSDGSLHFYEDDPGFPDRYRIKYIQDRDGNYLAFNFKQMCALPDEQLCQVDVNSQHRIVYFAAYDDLGRILEIRDYAGRVWRYAYDEYGDLITFTTPKTDRYPEGLTERYVYTTPYYTGELQHKLVQVYDTAGRLYLENEYGTDSGLLSFGRIISQREGNGQRFLEYEDLSLVAGLPAGQPEIEEDTPAHQTVMVRRNGHPVHYIYNNFGNLIAREEDAWTTGIRKRLVTHYRYNRDGALIGQISPEGRTTQYLFGRDAFMHAVGDIAEDQLYQLQQYKLTWQERLKFGNRLTIVQRSQKHSFSAFQFPNPLWDIYDVATDPRDIIVKFTYEAIYQNLTSISHPQYTRSPFPNDLADDANNNPPFADMLTTLHYDASGLLRQIKYPDVKRDNLTNIQEQFHAYDGNGRLIRYEDRAGTQTEFVYFATNDGPKAGYLKRQTIDPKDQNNPAGLDLTTEYDVSNVGVVTKITTPKKQIIDFTINDLNQVTKVSRSLKAGQQYDTRFIYCRNMRVEQIERDIQNDNGQPLWGGTETQFFHYDENDNVVKEQHGSMNFADHFVTRHQYDDGDLRVGTVLPRGNRVRIDYDERRLPRKITRGAGSDVAVEVAVVYDGDGLLVEQRDGRNLKTIFSYDAFGRVTETRDFNEQENLYRLIRHDYNKAGNLLIERLFAPNGNNAFKLLYHASYQYNEQNQRCEMQIRRFQLPIAYNMADVTKENDTVPLPLAEPVRTLYFYDKSGRLIRIEQHGKRLDDNGNLLPNPTIIASTYVYNSVGWLIKETDPLGNETRTRYDKHGLVTRVDVLEKVPLSISPTGEEVFTTLFESDALDRLIAITDGLGNVTRFEYDSRDAVTCKIDPLGNIIRFEYDIYGRQIAECIEMTDTGLGGGTRQPNSDIVTKSVYDPNGNLIRQIDTHGTATEQVYDDLDRRIELRYVDGTSMRYRYDGNDNLVWVQDNNGLIRRTTYDPLDKPIRMDVDTTALKPNITVEGATYEAFEHDALGRMIRAGNDDADIHFKIDSLGRAYEESVKFAGLATAFVLTRHYDDFGFLGRFIYPNGRIVIYKPDNLNRIKRIENQTYGAGYPGHSNLPPQRMILENIYRGLRIGSKVFGNGAGTSYAYDGAGRIIEIAHTGTQNVNLLTLQHLYDAAANMRFKHEYVPIGNNYGEIYKYDSRYQLTHYENIAPPNKFDPNIFAPAQVAPSDNPQLNSQTQINNYLGQIAQVPNVFSYKYDKLGNRKEEYQPNQPLIMYGANNLNQYTQRNNIQYVYDLNGNLCQEKNANTTKDYIYNYRNQIVRVFEGVELARFRYDALGRLIWRLLNGIETYLLYDNENEIEEWRRPSLQQPLQLVIQYVNEIEIDSRCQLATTDTGSGIEYWYHKDLVNSTRLLTNSNLLQTLCYRYTPFGVISLITQIMPQAFLFVGRPSEKSISSYHFRNRTYNPQLGRFFSRDPKEFVDGPALYTYARNNPVNLTDPHGNQTESEMTNLDRVDACELGVSTEQLKVLTHFAKQINEIQGTGKPDMRKLARKIVKTSCKQSNIAGCKEVSSAITLVETAENIDKIKNTLLLKKASVAAGKKIALYTVTGGWLALLDLGLTTTDFIQAVLEWKLNKQLRMSRLRVELHTEYVQNSTKLDRLSVEYDLLLRAAQNYSATLHRLVEETKTGKSDAQVIREYQIRRDREKYVEETGQLSPGHPAHVRPNTRKEVERAIRQGKGYYIYDRGGYMYVHPDK